MNPKQIIKKNLPRKIFNLAKDIFYPEKIGVLEERLNSVFFSQYRDIASSEMSQKLAFRNAEFKVYSKHGGDGILAYIFSKIGVTNRTFVEIGVENGLECNTANLSFNFGWNGLLIDANEDWIRSAQNFYQKKLGNFSTKIKMIAEFVTAENINQLIKRGGMQGEIDLLSIDIDSNDYWIWRSITVINPRVVVMEYNASLGFRPITIKYNPHLHYQKDSLYFGASLTALSKLAEEMGYILVACDVHGHDAYFVKKDIAAGVFINLSPEEAFYPNPYTIAKFGKIENQHEQIKHLEFEEV
ncbi:MAG: hypothetical protein AAB787_00365 [Patescibacteria group bacterium]